MKLRAWAGTAGAAAMLCVLGCAILYRRGAEEDSPRKTSPTTTVTDREQQGKESIEKQRADLLASNLADQEERIGRLEAELASQASDRKRTEEPQRPVESQKAAQGDEAYTGFSGIHGPRAMAGLLGLDESQRTAFVEAYDNLLRRLRAQEMTLAKVAVKGDTTRIEIPAFPGEGSAFVSEWSALLTTLLTPEQQAQYKDNAWAEDLIPPETGQNTRMIVLEAGAGGQMTVQDYKVLPDGTKTFTFHGGPRDSVLRPYRHLLK